MAFQLAQGALEAAKWAFTTRRARRSDAVILSTDPADARPGDLVLARVDRIGSHKKLQLASGRGSELYPGDLVVMACAARYAPDQYEGAAKIEASGADMLASGGVIGSMQRKNARMSGPTRLAPIGVLCRADKRPLNVADYALKPRAGADCPTVVAGVGASMNAGKTTAVASLAHGLGRAGYRVAAIKATGTGAYGDYNAYMDAGAHYVADFVDVGMASTYREPLDRIVDGLDTLLSHAAAAGCDVAVVELADGVFQAETAAMLRAPQIRRRFDGCLFAAPDAASTVGGCAVLRDLGVEPAIVAGMVSRSPLAAREAEAAAGIGVATRDQLCDPAYAGALLARIRRASGRAAPPVKAAA